MITFNRAPFIGTEFGYIQEAIVKCRDLDDRGAFIAHMRERGVQCVFHYIPLHSAPAGRRFGEFVGEDRFTTRESERLVRLPLYFGMTDAERTAVIESALEYFERQGR